MSALNEPSSPQQSASPQASASESKLDAGSGTAATPPSMLERIKHHKVIQWTLAYAALAYTLLHGAEMLAASLGWPHGLIRLFTIVLLLGAPIVATIAWYHGHRGQQKVTASEFMIIALLLALGGGFLWRDARSTGHEEGDLQAAKSATATAAPTVALITATASSIAVLPFADLSPAKDQQYFSDGVAEEILNVLAKVDGLKVASRTSSFQFRNKDIGTPLIAKELGVRHVLEGSVRKAGDTVRITAQLIDTDTDAHLWSQTFDRPLTTKTIFAVQDEIAAAIVSALRSKMDVKVADAAPAPVPTGSVDAYGLFLRARTLFQARHDLGDADRLLDQAIQIDPKFADALAIRAAIYEFGGEYGGDLGDPQEERRKSRAFAEQALAINGVNSLALGVAGLGNVHDHMEGVGAEDYDKIFGRFDRALAIDPRNSNVLNWQGSAYNFVGDIEKAADIHRRCIGIDPAHAACRQNLAEELLSLGRKGEASAIIDAAADAGLVSVSPQTLIMLAELKRRDAFLFLAANAPALRGWRKFTALYEALSTPAGDHRALSAEFKAFLVENKAPSLIYALLNGLGDYQQPLLVSLHWIGIMAPYRQSPEFIKHMRASGLPNYWHKHGFPPQCKPLGANDFECK